MKKRFVRGTSRSAAWASTLPVLLVLPLVGCIHPLLSVKAVQVKVGQDAFVRCIVLANSSKLTPATTQKADELCKAVQIDASLPAQQKHPTSETIEHTNKY